MSKARSLADLISGGAVIEASEIADSTITGAKLASDISFETSGSIAFGDAAEKISGNGTDLKIESSGKIILDADSAATVQIADNNTQFIKLFQFSNFVAIESMVSDRDFNIRGNDGGSFINAVSFDMSEAGAATFNDKIVLGANKAIEFGDAGESISGDGTDMTITGNIVKIDAVNRIILDAQDNRIDFADNGNEFARFVNNGGQLQIRTGSSAATAISFDSSGGATFGDKIVLGANKSIEFGDSGETISGDGTSLTIASSHNTVIDSANQIIFDAGNGLNIYFRDDGTLIGQVLKSGNNDFKLKGLQSGKLFVLEGLDSGGSLVQALSLDMSDAGSATFNNNVTVGGNLTVNGTTTTLNTATLDIEDKTLCIAKGAADAAAANGAGIIVDGASASLTYGNTNDDFTFNKSLNVKGDNQKLVVCSSDHLLTVICSRGNTGSNIDRPVFKMFADGSQEKIRLDSSGCSFIRTGDIGIGTTSPTSKVDIRDANAAVQSRGLIYLSNNDTYAVNKGSQISLGGTYDTSSNDTFFAAIAGRKENSTSGNFQGYLQFSTRATAGNAERMRITSGGCVGIGHTIPERNLSVFKSDYPTIQLVNTATGKANADGSILQVHDTDMDLVIRNQENADIRFDTNGGNERMRIMADGKIGIGTTSPTQKLTIAGGNSAKIQFIDGGVQSLYFGDSGNSFAGYFHYDHPADQFRMNTSGNIVLTGGNVGIGTTSPISDLDVYGASTPKITVRSGNGTSASIKLQRVAENDTSTDFEIKNDGGELKIIGDNTSQNEYQTLKITTTTHSFFTNNTERLTIDSSGRVAIGTTSHSSGANITLSGQGFGTVGADSGSIAFGSNTSYQGRIYQDNATSIFNIENTYGSNNGDIIIKTNGSERLRVKGSGNIGIGTSSPANNLHIFTDASGEGILVKSTGNTYNDIIGDANRSSAGNNLVRFRGNWNSNSVAMIALSAGDDTTNKDDGRIEFFTSASGGSQNKRMVIEPNGNIGIGTSSPQSLFHIVGSSTSSQVIIENTDAGSAGAPDIFLYRNSASPADGDAIGHFEFRGKNSAGEETRYAVHNAQIVDQTDGTEDGKLEWQILSNGSFQKVLTLTPSEVVINEDSGDTNFRIESNGNANMLFVDGGNDKVGIGTSSPTTGQLVVHEETGNGATNSDSAHFTQNSNNINGAALSLETAIKIGGSSRYGQIKGLHNQWASAASALSFWTDNGTNTEKMRILNNGNVGIGTTSPSRKLHVVGAAGTAQLQSTGSTSALYFADTGSSSIDNQGIHSTGNNMAISAGGHFRFTVRNDGHVGIGETDPGYDLVVDGGANSTIRVQNDTPHYGDLQATSTGITLRTVGSYPLILNTNQTEAMRIHSNQRISMGTTASGANLELATTKRATGQGLESGGISLRNTGSVAGGNILPITARLVNGANARAGIGFVAQTQDGGNAGYAGEIAFYTMGSADGASLTNSFERVRINKSGNFGIGTSTPVRKLQVSNGFIGASESSSNISSDQYNEFADNSANWYNTKFGNWSSNPLSQYMIEVGFRNSSPDSSGAKFFQMLDQTTARVNINSDGDIQNHDNSYGGISDERIKQDIVDASSQWEDIKNIRIRKYKKKHDVIQYGEENAPIELGVISQELETVSPGLVKEDKADKSHADLHNDFTGENPQNVKYVKYSILYMKAVKALQEAMKRIETLETKVKALEDE